MSLRDYGRTAAILTVGDEVVEGRVSNENAAWICDALMQRGIWPRLVIAVPDDEETIARMLRVAWDSADVVIVSGGLGFTPDDVTRRAVARACLRAMIVDEALASSLAESLAWATPEVARALATFPEGAEARPSVCGGTPGFTVGDIHVLPGSPTEMRGMFEELPLPTDGQGLFSSTLVCTTTEDQTKTLLEDFESRHHGVRLGSYPDFSGRIPRVGLVLSSRDPEKLSTATAWISRHVPCTTAPSA